ncbi:dipeptide/oligopeptide/nickel ABC transporter permease/ATP-binding protein [Thermomonospora cellulosilytica]|uniref:Peptide/nickel transport system permease protein n=1 Tax=Thermomonospora cellulosilytica TaxID=1411118 RepID=A0A7W3MTF3_9ACTN|nr:dipeptide/oligopeptide/nickel ABC transporter permease/ATP-binding protein [Thermomonospora cellulosilytica]MBA9001568.1 peptide/nickel transport system permease protein [Thermomonospora cellulosilytica]
MLPDVEPGPDPAKVPADDPAGTPAPAARPAGKRRRFGWGFRLAVAWLVLVAGAALLADLLPIPHYDATLSGEPRSGPAFGHPFGTDALGRDILSRIVHGARVSLGVGLGAVLIGLLLGAPFGLVAGYYRGVVDRIIMTANDIVLAFPALVFALAVVAFAGAGVRNVLIVLGVLGAPAWVRLVRSVTMAYAQREFVTAARALGAKGGTVMRREIAPNVVLPALSYAFVIMAVVVVAEGSLAFLGLSVQAPTPTWGGMINEGRSNLDDAPHIVLVPSLVMFCTVLAFNLVGDRLQELTTIRHSGLEPRRARKKAAVTVDEPAAPERKGPAPLLEAVDVRTGFHTPYGLVRAVDGVSFTLERGRTLAIVGESGSGKSQLIRSVLGLLPPAGVERGGRVYLDGEDLTAKSPEQMRGILGTRMAAVFQDPMTALNPVRTVGAQVTEPLRVHRGMDRKEAYATAERLLASVGIPEPRRVLRGYPHQLSGGMRQRITIAMALSCDPEILFADEPTTALDVTVQKQIMRLLHDQRERRDMAMVLVSHDLAMVADWADEVIVMYAGRVVEHGPAAELFAAPRMRYTEALLKAAPDLTAPSHTRLEVIDGRPPNLVAPPAGCRFHPRCPFARERCAAEAPPLVNEGSRAYACWYPAEPVTVTEPAGPAVSTADGTDDAARSHQDHPAVSAGPVDVEGNIKDGR